MILIFDCETRSRCDLRTKGHANYARDLSTDYLCCAFTPLDPDDNRYWVWEPSSGAFPSDLRDIIENEIELIAAHNAPFDRAVWEEVGVPVYGFPEIDFDTWYCSMAQMLVNALPASLDDAARALNARFKKDPRGKALIKLLCVPQPDGEFNNDPKLTAEMIAYCIADIKATKGIMNATRLMTQNEHIDWLNNEDVNERGVLIDVELARSADKYANDEMLELGDEIAELTDGAVTKLTQHKRCADWVAARIEGAYALSLMTKHVDGEPKLSLDKGVRAELMEADNSRTIELSPDVYDFISIMELGSLSSVRKFKNMALRADDEDHRVRGAFIYCGAPQTKRFASRGLQMHNFPSRGMYKTIEEAWDTYYKMMKQRAIPAPLVMTLKRMLRHAIMPTKGSMLLIGDWSGIEARVLPWLSDSEGGDAKLDKIESGVDVYLEAAEGVGHKGNRPLGKVVELSLGYEGGVNAFLQFARGYGVTIPEDEVRDIINQWRDLNEWVCDFWHNLIKAARNALRSPGVIYEAGRIRYLFEPKLIDGTLLCLLPDDTILQYPSCRVEQGPFGPELTALKASIKMKADDKEWPREKLWGGKLAGHVTQGTAGALLREKLPNIEGVVAHVHDEFVAEALEANAEEAAERMRVEMTRVPEWAEGLPLDVEVEIARRYKK